MEYREIAPPARLADSVECFWSMRGAPAHRVTPDGCADILLRMNGGSAEIHMVGAMTRWHDAQNCSRNSFFGVRFRPGGWASRIGLPANRITDRIEPLDSLWGPRGRTLLDRLASAHSDQERASILETILEPRPPVTPVQRAIAWMEQRRGLIQLDHIADQCGLSVRQFRRVFLAETGLSPKFLARVLRFRYALSRVAIMPGADLALECGYYDQAHFINEFREFSGRTPAAR